MPLSATESISPALHRTTDLMFRPFRFRMWWRLAVIAALSGEFAGNGGNFGNYNFPHHPASGSHRLLALPSLPGSPLEIALLVTTLVAAGTVLLLIFTLINSIFRFLLLDVALTGRYRIREGWRRWSERGLRYFWWQLGFMAVSLATLAVVVGLPVLLAWRAGFFREPRQHLAALVGGGLALLLLLLVYFLAFGVTAVLAKDLVVAIMAAEKLGPVSAWRRLIPMMKSAPGTYVAYLGMKILLAIAAGILFAIADVVVLLVLLIPGVVLALAAVVMIKDLGLTWNPLTIALAVGLGAVLALGLLWLFAIVNAPAAVFFEFYVVLFFASRYPPLEAMMQAAPSPAPILPPLVPPAPAPA